MAKGKVSMGLAIIVLAVLSAGAEAQSSCTSALISLSPCLNYISGNTSTPSSGCCSQLASVVASSPQCLCQVLDGGSSSLGININQTQALALPGACNVQTPPISRCNAVSPAASPTGTPVAPSTPSGTSVSPSTPSGSKTGTSTQGTSDGSSIQLSLSLLFLVLAASYGSIF